MPFSFLSAQATFQRLMCTCLDKEQLSWCLIYLYGIIVFSKTLGGHLTWLRTVFWKLREVGLKSKHSKCEFFKKTLTYLGHNILEKGVKTNDCKIKVTQEWHTP